MKTSRMVLPSSCEILGEERSKTIYGGGFPAIIVAIVGLAWAWGYPAAGRYARKIWPKGIPSWAKVALMASFPDPVGWDRFMAGYNGN